MLNVYNPTYDRIGVIEGYAYLNWTRRYSSCGEFEFKTTLSYMSLLQIGNVVAKFNDSEAGIIEYIHAETVNKDEVTVTGRLLPSLLYYRIVWDDVEMTGNVGTVVGRLINDNCISPSDRDRKIHNMDYEHYVDVPMRESPSYKAANLLDAVSSICAEYDVGLKGELRGKISARRGTAVISLYTGRELSAVFSKEYENLTAQSYTASVMDYRNVAKVESDSGIVIVGSAAGLDRQEIYVKQSGGDITPEEYGRLELSKREMTDTLDGAVNLYGNLRYRTDYDVGDVVTVKSAELNIMKRLRITAVRETYDSYGFILDVTFGKPLPSLADKINMR